MNRPEAERARALLGRADADLAAVRALEAVETVPDEVVGFHAQQAVEKLLKAVLAAQTRVANSCGSRSTGRWHVQRAGVCVGQPLQARLTPTNP